MTASKTRFTAWPLLASGIILILIGLVCVFWPGLAFATVGIIVGIGFVLSAIACLSALFLGTTELATATLAVNGVLDLVIGILFCVYPITSALFIIWLMFAVLIFFGAANLVMGLRERSAGYGAAGTNRIIASVCAIVLAVLIILFPDLLPIYFGIVAIARGIMLVYTAVTAPREIEM